MRFFKQLHNSIKKHFFKRNVSELPENIFFADEKTQKKFFQEVADEAGRMQDEVTRKAELSAHTN